jgi:hypothetical protein
VTIIGIIGLSGCPLETRDRDFVSTPAATNDEIKRHILEIQADLSNAGLILPTEDFVFMI